MTRRHRAICGPADGFTLVEMLAASAILVMGLVLAFGALLTLQRSARSAQVQGDQTAEVRMSMNMIGEDLSFGQWCDNCSQQCTSIGQSTLQSNLTIYAYQTRFGGQGPQSNGVPGYLPVSGVSVLGIRYWLVNDKLTREITGDPTAKSTDPKVFSSQTLASGLNQCSVSNNLAANQNLDPDHLTVATASGLWAQDGQKTASVLLQRQVAGTGGSGSGPISALKAAWTMH